MSFCYQYTIVGRPTSKKNDNVIKRRGKKTFVGRSDEYKAWEQSAVMQLRRQKGALEILDCPLWVRVITYLAKGQAMDFDNAFGGPYDALQKAKVIQNDSLVRCVDGSRLRRDWQLPRVEIEIRPCTKEGEPI